MIVRLFQFLQQLPISTGIRESLWVYPIIESAHVLGMCLFLGFVAMMDLRLVSVTLRGAPVTEVQQRLFPWQMAGFAIMVISGFLLFLSEPMRFYGNVFFRIKVVLLLFAGINMAVFHSTVYRRAAEWDRPGGTPRQVRVAGALSLLLWTGVVVCGRMIAYNWFDHK